MLYDQVFRCLVEGCNKAFHTSAERGQHLHDQHCYPRGLHYETMHLGRRQGQHRPEEEFRRTAKSRPNSMDATGDSAADNDQRGLIGRESQRCEGSPAGHSFLQADRPSESAGDVQPPVKTDQETTTDQGCPGEDAMEVDELTSGMSRLSTASQHMAFVPRSVSFGRRGKQGLARGS